MSDELDQAAPPAPVDEEALAKAGRVTGSRKGGKAQKAAKGTGKARRKMKRKV